MKKLVNCLFVIFFVSYTYSQNKINISKKPSWVNFQDYNKNPKIDEDEVIQGALNLLADYQINIFKQESYFRLVTKITDNAGIQSASNISANYDPLYQKLIFHSIKIIRDNKEINKLFPDHFQVIRRETNAENYLYDGSLSAILNMADVRNGDIIDCSYTIKGFNPIHKGKYSESFILNDYVPIGKINVSINTKNNLNYKTYNTTLQPKITAQNGYTNFNWMVEAPESSIYENNTPPSKIVMPTVIVSNYSTWKEVVKWANDIFTQPETLSTNIRKKLQEINTNYKTQGEKIKAILNFVQNDIRYLGLEYGIGSYKPNSPNKVFEQRYGDCKDKSLLMVKMLKSINIEAYPMLVNTLMKSTITNLPPSPSFFNHCVVKVIDNKKRELYYDPTLVKQGGTYKNTHFPNYEYGLVVKKNNAVFDTITSSSNNKIITKSEYIIKEINGSATLKLTTTYTNVEADQMRSFFENNGKKNIQKEYENYYASFHPKIKMVDPPTAHDYILRNEFEVTQSYSIDSIWKPMELKPGFISIDFTPFGLQDALYIPQNIENRKNDIALAYPVSREHLTNITLPSAWLIETDYDMISNDVFYYDYDISYGKNKNEIHLKNFLKIQKSSITKNEFTTYYNDIKKLEKSFGFSIFINNDSKGLFKWETPSFSIGFIVFLVLLAILVIIFIIIELRKSGSI